MKVFMLYYIYAAGANADENANERDYKGARSRALVYITFSCARGSFSGT